MKANMKHIISTVTKTQKRNRANTHYQAIITSRLVNNTYIWQNYEQYVRPLFKEIKKMMKFAKKHMHKRTGTIAE